MPNRYVPQQLVRYLLFSILSVLLAAPSLFAATTIRTIDSTGSVGYYTSIAVDGSGNSHISYHDYGNYDLKYATNASGSWVTSTLDSTGYVGEYTSIAVDGSGHVHISYYDGTNMRLKYATNSSGSWVTLTLDNTINVGDSTSIAVDGSGHVHISYTGSLNADLKYATNASGSWVYSTLDTLGDVGRFNSLAVDSSGHVHISYLDNAGFRALKYATNASGSWAYSTLDSNYAVGRFGSLALDGSGYVHISYCDEGNNKLKYATNISGSWVTSTLDSIGYVGQYTSIGVDGSNVHISYFNSTNGDLKYATNASGSWVYSTLDSSGYVGEYSSLAMDGSNVHISYYDGTNADLKYALIKKVFTVSPSVGLNGRMAPATAQSVDNGLTTSFVITPDAGYSIDSVSGCGGSLVGSTYTTGAITGNCTVSASFALNSYTVTPSAGTGGSLSPDTAQSVNHGSTTSFTVAPNTGYSIASVSGCSGSLDGTTYTTGAITGNCTVSASFALNSYTVTPSTGTGGSLSPDTAQTVEGGQTTSFTLTPAAGFMIDSVGGTCGGSLVGSTYTTVALSADCTVTASFVELDTDADGTPDSTDSDDDNDGVSDVDEVALGTDPLVANAFVPQTGQTTCYDLAGTVIPCAGTGQDGDVQAGVARPDPRFTDNMDGTVTDNLTGLIWAQDASTPAAGAGDICAGGTKPWQGALDYVACLNSENYLGHNDWILPNVVELKSLVNAEQFSPVLPDGHPFTNVQAYYWSSSNYVISGYAWIVSIYHGYVNYGDKAYNYYVWPVRGGQSTLTLALPKTGQTVSYATGDDGDLRRGVAAPATRFIANQNGSDQPDGTVTDNLTGLTWLTDANCFGVQSWNAALSSANALASGACGLDDGSVAGDWRLPNARELTSLADYAKASVVLPDGHPFTNVWTFYWSSSTYAVNTAFAWYIGMDSGYLIAGDKTTSHNVWPVRGGVLPPPDTTPPAAPTQIEAIDLGVGEVLLSWVNPTDADFDHIVIYRSTVSGELGNVLVTPITNISYVDDTVAANTTYYYTVKAVDASGNESTNTAQLGLTTKNFDIVAPAAPTGLALLAGATAGTVEMSWTNPVADFTHVKIFRSTASGELGVQIAVTVGASYQDTQLYNDLVYYYTVKAVDAAGNVSVASAQETITLTTAEVLASGLVAALTVANPTPAPGGTLELSWTNPGDEDYLRIYRSGASGTLGELVYETFDAGYTDTGLTNNSTYFYTVRTVDSYGNENPDPTQVSALVDDDYAPANVTELSVALQGDGSAMLSWARSASPDAANYNIYWNNGSGDVDYALLSVLTSIGDPETTSWTSAVLDVDQEYQFGIRVDDLVNEEQNQDVVVSVNRTTTPQPVSARIKTPHTGKPVRGTHETVMAELVKGTPAEVRDVIFQLRTVDRSGPAYGDWVAIDSASVALPGVDATSPYFIHWETTGLNGEYQLRAVATDTATATSDPYPGFISVVVDNAQAANQEYADGSDLQHKQQALPGNAPNTLVMGDASGVTRVTVPAGGVTVADPLNPPLIKIDVRDPLDVALPAPPAGYGDGGVYRDISFDNGQSELNNGRKATIELPYLDAEGDGLIDGTTTSVYDLQLCNYHADSWSCLSSTLDAVHKTVRANSGQFSTYALLAPPKLVGNGLTMVTVPLHASPNSTASVLGPVNQYGSYTPVWNPATNSWITRPGTVEPGKSYFIWGNGKAIDVTGTEVSQVDFTISLAPGWNMLGNPFRYEVALDQLQVNCGTTTESLQVAANNGWVVGTFFHYLNGSWQTWSVQEGDNLPTWKGLYLLSDQNCTLTVPPTPAE